MVRNGIEELARKDCSEVRRQWQRFRTARLRDSSLTFHRDPAFKWKASGNGRR